MPMAHLPMAHLYKLIESIIISAQAVRGRNGCQEDACSTVDESQLSDFCWLSIHYGKSYL